MSKVKITSNLAWTSVNDSGLVSASRLKVYNWLYHNGPATQNEVNQGCSSDHEVSPSYHKRLSELERMGLAETVGVWKCRVSRRDCLVWRTTVRHVPIPFKKRQSKANKQNAALFELLEEVALQMLNSMNYSELRGLQTKIDNIKRMKADS